MLPAVGVFLLCAVSGAWVPQGIRVRRLHAECSCNLMGEDPSGVAMAGGAAAGGGLAFLLCASAGEVQLRGACESWQASVSLSVMVRM